MSEQMNSHIWQRGVNHKEEDASDYCSITSPPYPVSLDSTTLFNKIHADSPMHYLIRPFIKFPEDDGLDLYNEFIESLSDSDDSDDSTDEEDEEDAEDYIILDRIDLSYPNSTEAGILVSYKSKFEGVLAAKTGLELRYETANENLKAEISVEEHFESSESEWELV